MLAIVVAHELPLPAPGETAPVMPSAPPPLVSTGSGRFVEATLSKEELEAASKAPFLAPHRRVAITFVEVRVGACLCVLECVPLCVPVCACVRLCAPVCACVFQCVTACACACLCVLVCVLVCACVWLCVFGFGAAHCDWGLGSFVLP